MGGAKKRSLAQTEKQQKVQAKRKKATESTRKTNPLKSDEFNFQDISDEDLKELLKMKALTQFAVATKYNIKMSAAKNILKKLENGHIIQQVTKGGGLRIYTLIEK